MKSYIYRPSKPKTVHEKNLGFGIGYDDAGRYIRDVMSGKIQPKGRKKWKNILKERKRLERKKHGDVVLEALRKP